MEVQVQDFDWNDLRHFLAVARSRNPTRAARWLGVDHTTVRRRIAALEVALKARLFDPGEDGYRLTEQGKRLLESAEAMESLVLEVEGRITDADQSVAGQVRISASHGLGTAFLAPRLGRLCDANPELRLQLITLPRIANVSKREADIAIALEPPSRSREVVRKLTDCDLGLYASKDYLKRHPPVRTLDDIQNHRVVGFAHDRPLAPGKEYFARIASALPVQFESNNTVVQTKVVVAGQGIAVLPHFIAAQEPELQPLLRDTFKVRMEYWLIVHPDLRNLARIRAVIDFLVAEFDAAQDLFVV